MRTARPVGLSQDGKSLIVKTGDGEQIAVLADAGLRDLLRNRPRPQLEIEMESALTPREIQMKIRAGASVDELAEASGMAVSRVEAFAAPVIAEREHIAGLAQSGSVRQAGESTGHRTLRVALTQRLRDLKIDPETVAWDSFKMDDGRWSVSAEYQIEQTDRHAVFYFDQRGRFSVAGNDEARWAIGEAERDDESVADESDSEPTLKLASSEDELALLRSVETEHFAEGRSDASADEAAGEPSDDSTNVAAADETVVDETVVEEDPSSDDDQAAADSEAGTTEVSALSSEPLSSEPEVTEDVSQLDLLYDLLGSDGYAEDSVRVFDGLSDAAAVPEVPDAGWTPPVDEPEPVDEPGPDDTKADDTRADDSKADDSSVDEPTVDESTSDQPVVDDAEPEIDDDSANEEPANSARPNPTQLADGATQDILPVGAFEEPIVDDLITASSASSPSAVSEEPVGSENPAVSEEPAVSEKPAVSEEPAATAAESPEPEPAPKPKPKKKKRASVPSWDEIMFGARRQD